MIEEWRDVIGFEGFYKVSNLGRIVSLERVVPREGRGHLRIHAKELKPVVLKIGYYSVALTNGVTKGRYFLHRVLSQAFIPNPYGKKCINHINGDKLDNRLSNLEWVSHRENNLHAYKTGLRAAPKGGDSPVARLIIDLQTGIFYDTIKDAAYAKSINVTTLRNYLRNGKGNKHSLQYA